MPAINADWADMKKSGIRNSAMSQQVWQTLPKILTVYNAAE